MVTWENICYYGRLMVRVLCFCMAISFFIIFILLTVDAQHYPTNFERVVIWFSTLIIGVLFLIAAGVWREK